MQRRVLFGGQAPSGAGLLHSSVQNFEYHKDIERKRRVERERRRVEYGKRTTEGIDSELRGGGDLGTVWGGSVDKEQGG